MTTLIRQFTVDAGLDQAWAAIADVGAPNRLIDFLGEVRLDGNRRTCSLGEQGVLDEWIVAVDETRRRVAYSIRASPFDFDHHHASMEVASGEGGTVFTWTTDFLPDERAAALTPVIDAAIASITRSLSGRRA